MNNDIQVVALGTKNILEEDYKYAAMNILWLREDIRRTILFCSIELYPQEIEEITGTQEIGLNIKKFKHCGLYFKRYVLPVAEAIKWFYSEDHKMIWDEQHKDLATEFQTYVDEPSCLKFNVSNSIPFSIKSRETVRVCSKFSINFNQHIKNYLKQPDVTKWLSQNFIFDLLEYPEYICSINIVAYNPLFRKINYQIVPAENANGILFTFEKRNNVTFDDVKLIYAEKRPTGYSDVKLINIQSSTVFIQSNFFIEKIAYAVFCTRRGLLAYNGFHSFVNSINLNFNIVEKIKRIEVPDRNDPSKLSEINEVPQYHTEQSSLSSNLNNNVSYQNLMNHLYQELEFRKQKEKAYYQKIFYDDNNQLEKRAKHFVRELISNATDEVWFIDPYFATHELFSFADTVTHPNIKVHIVTSKLILDKKLPKNVKEYAVFQKALSIRNNYNAFVMLGDQPIFHDRFIIIDNSVWLSGNSLGTIGERVSYMIKLENPQEFLSTFEKYREDTTYIQPFNDWIKNKKEENN